MIRAAVLLAVAAAAPVWAAPPNPMQLTRKAGLTPETHEFVFLHVHSHLDVFINGKKVLVPAGIGIDIHNKAVRKFTNPQDGSTGYGGISPPCSKVCISPLHTHFDDGILHTEAQAAAVKLKALLDRERSEEVARNRVRLVRGRGDRVLPPP